MIQRKYNLVIFFSIFSIVLFGQSNGEVYLTAVEEMPQFLVCGAYKTGKGKLDKCSERKLLQFFFENITCSTMPLDSRVLVSFVIEANGSISNAEVQKCSDKLFEKELIRIVYLMNTEEYQWKSGRQNGQPVRVRYMFPLIICWE